SARCYAVHVSPFQRLPGGSSSFRSFHRAYATRLPGPLGCLLMLVVCPIGLLVGAVMFVAALLPARRRAVGTVSAAGRAPDAREAALLRFIEVMALDETFTLEEARQSGTLATSGATVDELLAMARERGWVEARPGERLTVTARGRE